MSSYIMLLCVITVHNSIENHPPLVLIYFSSSSFLSFFPPSAPGTNKKRLREYHYHCACGITQLAECSAKLKWPAIVLFKMFLRWFFANKKLIITLRTWNFGDLT